jgi:hypothetical protein
VQSSYQHRPNVCLVLPSAHTCMYACLRREGASGETAHEHEQRLNGMRANPKHRPEASASFNLLYYTICLRISSDLLQSWLRERTRAPVMSICRSCQTPTFEDIAAHNKGVRIVTMLRTTPAIRM